MDVSPTSTRHSSRYSLASITLHWVMLVLIAGAYAAIELREFFPKGTDTREAMKSWHFMLGLSVLWLIWIRILLRLAWRAPRSLLDQPAWSRIMARAAHLALYVFMIGMPIAGWVVLSAEGKDIPYFGLQLPSLVGENVAVAERVERLHKLGGTVGYWLIGLHAAAALFHHYVFRDGVLSRMLPLKT